MIRDTTTNNNLSQHLNVIFWNVENLFHPESGGPRGNQNPEMGWTMERYQRKITLLGAAMTALIVQDDIPIIFGLCEIEDERVIRDVLKVLPPFMTAAIPTNHNLPYLDTTLLYDTRSFTMRSAVYHRLFQRFDRGDVLQVELTVPSSNVTLSVFAVHLKARPENQYLTDMYREAVCDNLQHHAWTVHNGDEISRNQRKRSNLSESPEVFLSLTENILIMGDFNDEPFSTSLMQYLRASFDRHHVATQKSIERIALYNCSWEGLADSQPGSYYYPLGLSGPWSMLDQIVISPALLNSTSGATYIENSFQVIRHLSADSKGIPRRMTYQDQCGEFQWDIDGISDHFPVSITLAL
jgi:hypothetical protein